MKLNWTQRIVSAVASCVLVTGMVPPAALAEGAATLDTMTPPGYSLTVTGLENGDTATYYKIIEQDSATGKWKLTAAVDKNADGKVDVYDADGVIVVGDTDYTVDDFIITDKTTADKRVLNKDMMNAIAEAVTANKAQGTNAGTAANGQIAVAGSNLGEKPAGMYMFVATPGTSNLTYIYKPVFASVDYYNTVSTPDDGTHAVSLVNEDGTYADYAGDDGVFKKSPITIDKKSGDDTDWQQDVAVGDDVQFTIEVPFQPTARTIPPPSLR